MKTIQAVVFMGMNPWRYSEIHDTVRFLTAACKRVDRLYIDPPAGLKATLRNPGSLLGAARWQRAIDRGLEVLTPPLGFAPVFLGLRGLADVLAAARFGGMLRKRYGQAWRDRTLIYISSWSYTQTRFIEQLKPRYLVFHILDDSFAFPLVKDHPRVLAENKAFFRAMMEKSSLVLAVSEELAQKYSERYHRPVHVVKNGVDVEHFRRQETSPPVPEMEAIPRPVLMYTGSVNSWVDLQLLNRLAEARPGYSLVLIGHYYEGTANDGLWRALLAKPNVYWLNSRPYTALPGYIRYASALLLPRTQAEHSRASDPLKLYEYLSTGKPVISTALPAVEAFREFVYVARSAEEFAEMADTAVKPQALARAKRQADIMREHSWTARLNEMAGLLSAHCGVSF